MAGGKWRTMMSMKPRNLPVFHAPDIKRQAIADTKKWDVVPEGYDTTAYMNNLPRTLKFTQAKDDKYFVDVFLTDSVFVDWSAEAPPWITLSSRNGTLNPRREESSTRIWVTADWRKIPRYVVGGKLTFLAGGQTRMVNIEIERRSKESLKYKGFVERNGVVSMSANHYSRLNQGKDQRWIQIDEFGLLGPRMMSVLDSGSANDVKPADASMTYQFFSESQSNAKIRIFSLPTHPLNKSLSCRYGIKVDEHPMEIVDIKTVGRSEEWKENVLRNEAVREISLPVLARGEHTLTLYAIDPGIVLDRILILFGTTPLPYSVVPETR